MIAALYVETGGVYFGLPDVEPWDATRDARLYPGPHPVVAHPPCARWSRLAGQVEYRGGPKRGEDGGCFAAALEHVRRYGGVLEHPQHTAAWQAFGLPKPIMGRGWTLPDAHGGSAVCVDQGHYGHRVRKPTWLYAVRVDLPQLEMSRAEDMVRSARPRTGAVQLLSRKQRKATPIPFRDLLLGMARSAR